MTTVITATAETHEVYLLMTYSGQEEMELTASSIEGNPTNANATKRAK